MRHDVHHVAVALDRHVIPDLHAAGFRHAAQVVAAEVHQHDVFRLFLFIGQQLVR